MYVLVHWVETNQSSILDEEMVVDKTMLTDTLKVGMVKHGDVAKKAPKHGWKAYPAKVIAVNESKSFLLKQEELLLESLTAGPSTSSSDEKKSRAERKKRVLSSDDEGEEVQDDTSRKEKERQRKRVVAEKMAMRNIISSAKASPFSSDDEHSDDNRAGVVDLRRKIKALEKSEGELRQQVKKLKNQNFLLQEGLADKLGQVVRECICEGFVKVGHTQHGEGNDVASSASSVVKESSSAHMKQPSNGRDDFAADATVDIKDLVQPPVLMQIRRAKDVGKMTCQLMTAVFEPEDLSSSLVTGKRLKQEDKRRPVLDQAKVNCIIATVLEQHPSAQPSEIRAKMAQKCKDMRLAQKRMKPNKTQKPDEDN